MGREVRNVPENWDHPITEDCYNRSRLQPMYDQTYEDACAEWLADFDRIRAGGMCSFEKEVYKNECHWASHNIAPDPEYYRPWSDCDAKWYQLWETVSEGTPVSPPFETKEGIIDYLANNGDFWDQKRCNEPSWGTLYGGVHGVSAWGRQKAERFIMGSGFAPSLVVKNGKVMTGVDAVTE